MKILLFLLTGWLAAIHTLAQDKTLILSEGAFPGNQQLLVSSLEGWVFRQGDDPAWAKKELDTHNWQRLSPDEIHEKLADPTGMIEGWFRLKIKVDSGFAVLPLYLLKGTWAAADLYLDGRLVHSYGSTGRDGRPFEEHNPVYATPIPIAVNGLPQQEHVIAIHFVKQVQHRLLLPPKRFGQSTTSLLTLAGPKAVAANQHLGRSNRFYASGWLFVALVLSLLLWLLSSLDMYEKTIIRLLTLGITLQAIEAVCRFLWNTDFSYAITSLTVLIAYTAMWTVSGVSIVTLVVILRINLPLRWIALILALHTAAGILDVYYFNRFLIYYHIIFQSIVFLYLVSVRWSFLKGAALSIVIGILFALFFALLIAVFSIARIDYNFNLLFTLGRLSFPISFVVYVALRMKEILGEVREHADQLVKVSEEKEKILAHQNQLLEQQVEARTAELKASQSQLIQKEKMASLGELTAGIAHEIQNPLNFVNNFAEVSAEMAGELHESLQQGDLASAAYLSNDLRENMAYIVDNGQRAAGIVRAMLEHSRSGSGERRPTHLNELADEYLKLAYLGVRAQDPDLQVELITDFDETLPQVEVAPQEIGRVLLNLYNNAFYAMREKQARQVIPAGVPDSAPYQPTVWVSTRQINGFVELSVKDNGPGIPEEIISKIFQPFFTTKPTGQGTGLGLSLSYDIVTKGHGGEMRVESVEGESSVFVVRLPV